VTLHEPGGASYVFHATAGLRDEVIADLTDPAPTKALANSLKSAPWIVVQSRGAAKS